MAGHIQLSFNQFLARSGFSKHEHVFGHRHLPGNRLQEIKVVGHRKFRRQVHIQSIHDCARIAQRAAIDAPRSGHICNGQQHGAIDTRGISSHYRAAFGCEGPNDPARQGHGGGIIRSVFRRSTDVTGEYLGQFLTIAESQDNRGGPGNACDGIAEFRVEHRYICQTGKLLADNTERFEPPP